MNCNLCDGPLIVLGSLGNTTHFRCRNCGAPASITKRIRRVKKTS